MVASHAARKNSAANLSQMDSIVADRAVSAGPFAPADPRVEHLLSVAKSTFTLKGFAPTTMDDIAGAAGMSKKTLYKMFASKGDLFRAVLLRSLPQFRFGDVKPKGSAKDQLRVALRRILEIALSPEEIALHRLIVGERLLSPEIAGVFADVIFEMGAKGVVDALGRAQLKPEMRDLPVKLVSDMILGCVFANDHFRSLVDDSFRPSKRILNRRIELAIALFCDKGDDLAGPALPV